MIDIYIRGNRVDTFANLSVGMKFTGGIFRLKDNCHTRSYSLQLPDTKTNREVFNFDNLPFAAGVRRSAPCRMVVDGVATNGVIYLVSWRGGVFEMLFIQDMDTKWLQRPLSEVPFPDTLTVTGKTPVRAGQVPNFGWYPYSNGVFNGDDVGNPATLYPVANLAYLIRAAAAANGYGVQYLNDGTVWEDAENYGIVLPKMEAYSQDTLTVTGSGHGGFTYTVGSGASLADIGLSIVTRRFKKGAFGANITVQTFTALRHITVRCTPGGWSGPLFANGVGKDNDWLNFGEFTGYEQPYAPLDLEMNAGDYFTLISPQDLVLGVFNYFVSLNGGYETPIVATVIEVLDDDGVAGEGEIIALRDNLPDMTLAELIQAYCLLTCSSWDIDNVNHVLRFISFSRAVKEAGADVFDITDFPIVGGEDVDRYIDNFAQNNIINCKSEKYVTSEHKFRRNYPCGNDYLEDEAEFGVIPFNEGNWHIDGNGFKIADFQDVTKSSNGDMQYNGAASLFFAHPTDGDEAWHLQAVEDNGDMGRAFKALTEEAVTLRISVVLPFSRFNSLKYNTIIHFRESNYIIKEAAWNGNVCNFVLIKL